jgi:hypothetical protein
LKLHQRGLDLLLNVHDAIDHASSLTEIEIRELLAETEAVLRDLLGRDMPLAEDEFKDDKRDLVDAASRWEVI